MTAPRRAKREQREDFPPDLLLLLTPDALVEDHWQRWLAAMPGCLQKVPAEVWANRAPGDKVQLPPSLSYSNLLAFLPDRSGEPAAIPVALRQQLLAHCLESADEDKKSRAKSALLANGTPW